MFICVIIIIVVTLNKWNLISAEYILLNEFSLRIHDQVSYRTSRGVTRTIHRVHHTSRGVTCTIPNAYHTSQELTRNRGQCYHTCITE